MLVYPKGEKKMRAQETIINGLKKGEYISVPKDVVITIESVPNMVSSKIDIHLVNETDGTDCKFCIPNKTDSWKWLKRISETSGRTVLYKCGNEEAVPYEESIPYIHRFVSKEKAKALCDIILAKRKLAEV